jgi:hypothetical protein
MGVVLRLGSAYETEGTVRKGQILSSHWIEIELFDVKLLYMILEKFLHRLNANIFMPRTSISVRQSI